jgi:GntR family transcriptional regulator, transcriptional repressor for pyruvate dehydrogenase complex
MTTAPDDILSALRLERRRTPSEEVTQQLLGYLLSGQVRPGTRLPSERRLAERLRVGRSAVREAIKSLSLLGLLEVRQGSGAYLSGHTSDLLPRVLEWGLLLGEPSMRDLIELRHYLEVAAAGLAAERASTEDVQELRAQLARMGEAGTDVPAYVEADLQFHLRLAQAGGNGVLASLISNIGSLTRVWATRVLEHAGETASSLAMHQPIVDAVAAGDVEAARRAMEAHMERAIRRLHAALDAEEQPAAASA